MRLHEHDQDDRPDEEWMYSRDPPSTEAADWIVWLIAAGVLIGLTAYFIRVM